MLEVETLVLGPVETNVYLVGDISTNECVVIDPAWDGEIIAQTAERRGWTIQQIWLTHAHFDHLGGVAKLVKNHKPPPPVCLHPADLPLWKSRGGAAWFGLHIDPGPEPEILLEDQMLLKAGSAIFRVRHTPGHTPGHVAFYAAEENSVFCGDLIFAGGIGRTDLPGGDFQQLMDSITTQILTLPDDVILYSGHGSPTNVGAERRGNFFLNEFI